MKQVYKIKKITQKLINVIFTEELIGQIERLSDGQNNLSGELLILAGKHMTIVVGVGLGLRREGKIVEIVLVLAHVVYMFNIMIP